MSAGLTLGVLALLNILGGELPGRLPVAIELPQRPSPAWQVGLRLTTGGELSLLVVAGVPTVRL